MTEQALKPEPQADPNAVPCAICKSDMHPTGNHHTGSSPEDGTNGNHHTGDTQA